MTVSMDQAGHLRVINKDVSIALFTYIQLSKKTGGCPS